MGSYDYDQSNDLTAPDGTTLNAETDINNLRKMHYDFGEKCEYSITRRKKIGGREYRG